MKKKLIFSLMLTCIALFVYQGVTLAGITGKIAGIITDAATGEPLPAVNIVIEGTTLGGATDNEGHYFIINIPPGTYTLQASMVGYTVESKTGVIVNVDHTTPVDFDMRVTAIAGEEVTVTAEREIVPMDISASHIVADAEQIVEVPMVTDIAQYIHLQAGIEGDYVRGGGLDQTQFMMDGLSVVDNRANKPMMMVNLSSVKELNIIKGGFNAEYGNVRSGLINVVTREGSPSIYHGSFDFRISPPHLKHGGPSLYNPNNFTLRPYLDPAVCWVGTEGGTWDKETRDQYPSFSGWNLVSEKLLEDTDPVNDRTPEECRDLYIWRHMSQAYPEWDVPSADDLAPETWPEGYQGEKQRENKYGHKPDRNVEASFGGPVPYIGKYLGNLSFFISYRNNWEMFGLPTLREYYKESNTHLKLTSRLSPSIKLTVEGLYGEINTISRGVSVGNDDYMRSGNDIFWAPLATNDHSSWSGGAQLYWPASHCPFDIFRSMTGISFDHVLSPSTFYNVRISHVHVKNFCPDTDRMRDLTTVRYFGNTPIDEQPYGYEWRFGPTNMTDGMMYAGDGGYARDWSESNSINAKFDLTSQIDRYNQIKAGFIFVYDDLNTHYARICQSYPIGNNENKWKHFPIRGGAYIQDKLEFEGMITNFGVDVFTEIIPQEPAKGHLKISPRLGVSHPISENAKLYFNYGHFYSMPSSISMYQINWGSVSQGIRTLGNPSANLPKTVSYELGVEYNVRNIFLIHLSGYYKNVNDQTGSVQYTNFDGTVDYSTTENNNYSDIRGFELRLDRRFGRWITGWFNYNYMVQTSGYIGRQHYYEDERMQKIYGLQNPYQERPLARPVARAAVNFRTPIDWGPKVAAINPFGDLRVSLLFDWKAGRYDTWDPLETYELRDNIQWKAEYFWDARFSKRVQLGKYNLVLFADIENLFNRKYLRSQGFEDSADEEYYLKSLHLPMYEGEDYKAAGWVGGNDKPGDVKSDDKPYIDMPNRDFLRYLNERAIFFGIKIDF